NTVRSKTAWFFEGVRNACALPALVLMAAQVGFAALAREAGFTLEETLFLTLAVWALPSQVVFVGLVGTGASAAAVALAVTLTAVRFMPMLMAWVPVVRAPQTPRWQLFLASWFMAITAWVFTMARLPQIDRPSRLPFFLGFALTLTVSNTAIVAVAYSALPTMPALVAAGLVFLTPIYFLMALWGAARGPADRLAMGAGLTLGPLFAYLTPGADLLLAGLIGGTAAYVLGRLLRGQRS
ncbi:MAG: AzlC family ABC transporter permease, partial [Pseudomonadota bacterium]